jgi:hypothetical protein
MDCRGSLIFSHLALPGLDPDEVRFGQMAALFFALSVLLATQLLSLATMLF